jgi:arginase
VLVATYQPTRTNGRHKHPDLNYAIHLDVDVVDFTDAPLSEHPSRNTGLKLDEMLRALRVLASGPGLVAITLA